MRVTFLNYKNSLVIVVTLFFFSLFLPDTAFAHHPFKMGVSADLSFWQALISGIGHPLLGPDHLIFMLGIAFAGIKKTKNWVIPLLTIGLTGTALVQLLPLPDVLTTWAEGLVSLSLVIEGFIILNRVNPKWLFPMFALHGYLLGNTIVGAEPTPLIGYFLGLLVSQATLLILVTVMSQKSINWLGGNSRFITSGVLIGIGSAFSWVALVG